MMKEMWDSRYSEPDSAYGTDPNAFFRQEIMKLKPGKILLPADGESRNGVFAAESGWEVSAFDLSVEGKRKAEKLAASKGVSIDYQVGEFTEISFPEEHFDAIGLIFAHFSAETKSAYHRQLSRYLKPGGVVIFEAFSKSHLKLNAVNPAVGGPKDLAMLFSTDELRHDFPDYEIIELDEVEVDLREGKYHNGLSSVVRFVGVKK